MPSCFFYEFSSFCSQRNGSLSCVWRLASHYEQRITYDITSDFARKKLQPHSAQCPCNVVSIFNQEDLLAINYNHNYQPPQSMMRPQWHANTIRKTEMGEITQRQTSPEISTRHVELRAYMASFPGEWAVLSISTSWYTSFARHLEGIAKSPCNFGSTRGPSDPVDAAKAKHTYALVSMQCFVARTLKAHRLAQYMATFSPNQPMVFLKKAGLNVNHRPPETTTATIAIVPQPEASKSKGKVAPCW
ncbi:hypothetical protein V8C37DRAFT_370221 [Trichoderma ceciliae]